MLRPRDDDLFKDSTMTFGEHLEELRASLMKAVISIGVGTVIGFFLGQSVVELITAPLQRALVSYYQYLSRDNYQSWFESQRSAGRTPPYTPQEVEHLLFDRELIYQIHYVHPHIVAGALQSYWREHPEFGQQGRGGGRGAMERSGQGVAKGRRVGVASGGKQSRAQEAAGTGEVREGGKASRRAETEEAAGGSADVDTRSGHAGDEGGKGERATAAHRSGPGAAAASAGGDASSSAQPEATADVAWLMPLVAWYPLREDPRIKPSTLGAPEGFMIYLKASLVVGIIISSPFAFYFIWSFIAAGLYPHEKRYVYVFAPFSLALFLSGAALAYFFVFGPVLSFLFDFNRSLGLEVDLRISEWLSFVLLLPLGFGISFQLPLVMLFLERLGILSVEAYLSKWRIAVMVIVVVSAVLTPADPVSVWFMLLPLLCLYFGGILLCKWMPRVRRPA
jgi:sec-independent protein translocase protein TatC